MGGDLLDDELPLYTDNGDGDDWDFADEPVDSHFDVKAIVLRELDVIC